MSLVRSEGQSRRLIQRVEHPPYLRFDLATVWAWVRAPTNPRVSPRNSQPPPISVAIPYRSGILVKAPLPERFAVHNLIIADRRKDGPDSLQSRKSQAARRGGCPERSVAPGLKNRAATSSLRCQKVVMPGAGQAGRTAVDCGEF
jgi:hypothetical protein